ncbi:hypothetical protein NMY22_g11894 [Coprinellus aureogranulatus]|nr:hypothetical protein NMY22_g11894 [Coprinellus aureogranulatus]
MYDNSESIQVLPWQSASKPMKNQDWVLAYKVRALLTVVYSTSFPPTASRFSAEIVHQDQAQPHSGLNEYLSKNTCRGVEMAEAMDAPEQRAALEALLDGYRATTLTNYIATGGFALVVFDYFCTLPEEIRLIWPTPWSVPKVLFFVLRYYVFVNNVFAVLYNIPKNLTPGECRHVFMRSAYSTPVLTLGAEAILFIRVYAFSGGSYAMRVYLICQFIAIHGTSLVLLIKFVQSAKCEYSVETFNRSPATLPELRHVCASVVELPFRNVSCMPVQASSNFLGGVWTLLLGGVIIVMALMITIALGKHRGAVFRAEKTGLLTVFYRDGIFYFLILGTFLSANIFVTFAAPEGYKILFTQFAVDMHSVLSTRMLLHLREWAEREQYGSALGAHSHTLTWHVEMDRARDCEDSGESSWSQFIGEVEGAKGNSGADCYESVDERWTGVVDNSEEESGVAGGAWATVHVYLGAQFSRCSLIYKVKGLYDPCDLSGWDFVLGLDFLDVIRREGFELDLPECHDYDDDANAPAVCAFGGDVGTEQRFTVPYLFSSAQEGGIHAHNRPREGPCARNRSSEPSTSYIASPAVPDLTGYDYCVATLFGDFDRGPGSSLFSEDLSVLRGLLDLHGIEHVGICFTVQSCRALLVRHLFSGHCMMPAPGQQIPVACSKFSVGFDSWSALSKSLFELCASAPSDRLSTDRLHLLGTDLELSLSHGRSHYRQRLRRLFQYESTRFAPRTHRSTEDYSDPSTFLKAFRRHEVASLWDIARKHHVHIPVATATAFSLRRAILFHLASGECKHSIWNQRKERELWGIDLDRLASVDDDAESLLYRIRVLIVLKNSLTKSQMMELLDVLGIERERNASISHLRNLLSARIIVLRQQLIDSIGHDTCGARSDSSPTAEYSWPQIVPEEIKDDCIRNFRDRLSIDSLREEVCASCASLVSAVDLLTRAAGDLDLECLKKPHKRRVGDEDDADVVDSRYDTGNRLCFDGYTPFRSHPDVLLDPDGVLVDHAGIYCLRLCKECNKYISRRKTPPLSLANHNFIGRVPPELKDLTVVEEAMIARCRSKCWVIKLTKKRNSDEFEVNDREDDNNSEDPTSTSPAVQRGMKGNIIVYPQRPEGLMNLLPRPIEELTSPICAIFVGPKPPSREWLRKKATPLAVNPTRVRNALMWLKEHNELYRDVEINDAVLDTIPDDYVLPVDVHICDTDEEADALTSRYDNIETDFPDFRPPENHDIVYNSTVIADVNCNATSQELRAAAMAHMKRYERPYLEIPHGRQPEKEFYNADLLPNIYPCLFPYGVGGFENSRKSTPLSFARQIRRVFSLADRRFQEHYSFLFTVFNILQKRNILYQTDCKVRRTNFEQCSLRFSQVSEAAVHRVTEKVMRSGLFIPCDDEERLIAKCMKDINVVTSHVPGSASSKLRMRNEIRALMMSKGLPNFYLTINPADVYNPVVRILGGSEFDLDKLYDNDSSIYWQQSCFVARNPYVAATFFDKFMHAFFDTLLAYEVDPVKRQAGILGKCDAYYGCVEAQGRGSLHCHMLIWIADSLNPNQLKDRVLSDPQFKENMIRYLDDCITTSIPDPPNIYDDVPSSRNKPASVFGLEPVSSPEQRRRRDKDIYNLAYDSQRHRHNKVCYKYCRPGDPKICRFSLDSSVYQAETKFDDDSGELCLRCLDGLVNNFNREIIESTRCNMDIKFIGSGTSAKAILYYITDYITKSQMKAHVAYNALELALHKLDEHPPGDDGQCLRAKSLLQKCAFAMVNSQELSAQQVMSYLMNYGDHYTSHDFRRLFWPALERQIASLYDDGDLEQRDDVNVPSYLTSQQELGDESESEGVDDDSPDCTSEPTIEERLECAVASEEIEVVVGDDGKLCQKTDEITDYQLRAPALKDLSLWEFIACTRKVDIPKKKKQQLSESESCSEDTEDEPMLIVDHHESESEGELEGVDIPQLLADTGRKRPRFGFRHLHPDSERKEIQILHPNKRYIPLLIGCSLPRRDKVDVYERYCRVMLMLFKPWEALRDIRGEANSWSDAFADFQVDCPENILLIMDNIQLLHECRDSKDDYYARRRDQRLSQNENIHGNLFEDGSGFSAEEDLALDGMDTELLLDHLDHVEGFQSRTIGGNDLDAVKCVNELVACGIMDMANTTDQSQALPGSEELVSRTDSSLEDIWKRQYKLRKKRRLGAQDERGDHDQDDTAHRSEILQPSIRENLDALVDEPYDPHLVVPEMQHDSVNLDIEKRNAIAHQRRLNTLQAKAYNMITDKIIDNEPREPLRLYLGGAAGTGKSTVVESVQQFFEETERGEEIKICAFTGVAAKNINGVTLHSALSLASDTRNRNTQAYQNLVSRWEKVRLLIIDEISMIGCRMMNRISQSLSIAKQNGAPFGGLSVVFSGDFAQLSPIKDVPLYSKVSSEYAKLNGGQNVIFGKLMWLSVTHVVILYQIMRQDVQQDLNFVCLLHRLRLGKCTDDDYKLLCQRVLKNHANNHTIGRLTKTPVIVTSNSAKDEINLRRAMDFSSKTKQPLNWYHSTDTFHGHQIPYGQLKDRLDSMSGGTVHYRPGKIPLVVGMPVMLTQNLDVERGIVNGTIGTLKHLRYTIDELGERHLRSCIIESDAIVAANTENLEHCQENEFAVYEESISIALKHRNSKAKYTVNRRQVPIVPAYAVTVHKAQGKTLDTAIVDLARCKGTESPYVMLSRVKTLDGLFIARDFPRHALNAKPKPDLEAELYRLKTIMRRTVPAEGEDDRDRQLDGFNRIASTIADCQYHEERTKATEEQINTLQRLESNVDDIWRQRDQTKTDELEIEANPRLNSQVDRHAQRPEDSELDVPDTPGADDLSPDPTSIIASTPSSLPDDYAPGMVVTPTTSPPSPTYDDIDPPPRDMLPFPEDQLDDLPYPMLVDAGFMPLDPDTVSPSTQKRPNSFADDDRHPKRPRRDSTSI